MPEKKPDYEALPTHLKAPTIRQELRVVAIVITFVLLLEIISRIIAPYLDYDREHIHAFSEIISSTLEEAESKNEPSLVFFGNSLMLHGLDLNILEKELSEAGAPSITSTKITPVGTAMIDWVFLYKRYFENAEQHPDILILGFVSHHINDQEDIKLRRLSRHFVAPKNFPELWREDLGDFHRIAQSSLAHVSALEGDQPEHQLGILSTIISDYRTGLNQNNNFVRTQIKSPKSSGAPEETFTRMERFINTTKKDGVEIWFVAMPQPGGWNLNPEAIKLAKKHGMKFLDARQLPNMKDEDFSDGYHLGKTGSEKFTKWMAKKVKNNLPKEN